MLLNHFQNDFLDDPMLASIDDSKMMPMMTSMMKTTKRKRRTMKMMKKTTTTTMSMIVFDNVVEFYSIVLDVADYADVDGGDDCADDDLNCDVAAVVDFDDDDR